MCDIWRYISLEKLVEPRPKLQVSPPSPSVSYHLSLMVSFRFSAALVVLSGLCDYVLATGVIIPLYIYPTSCSVWAPYINRSDRHDSRPKPAVPSSYGSLIASQQILPSPSISSSIPIVGQVLLEVNQTLGFRHASRSSNRRPTRTLSWSAISILLTALAVLQRSTMRLRELKHQPRIVGLAYC